MFFEFCLLCIVGVIVGCLCACMVHACVCVCVCASSSSNSTRSSHNDHSILTCDLCVFVPLTQGGHNFFNIDNNFNACCVHKGETVTNESTPECWLKRTEKVPHPALPRRQTLASGWMVQPTGSPTRWLQCKGGLKQSWKWKTNSKYFVNKIQTHKRLKRTLLGLIVQELCESRGGHPGLSVLINLLVSMDVKIYWTVLRHWSQLVPDMSTDIWGH